MSVGDPSAKRQLPFGSTKSKSLMQLFAQEQPGAAMVVILLLLLGVVIMQVLAVV